MIHGVETSEGHIRPIHPPHLFFPTPLLASPSAAISPTRPTSAERYPGPRTLESLEVVVTRLPTVASPISGMNEIS